MVAGKPLAFWWWLDSKGCHSIAVSHWLFCGGWTARVVTSLLNGGWKATNFGWVVAGKP